MKEKTVSERVYEYLRLIPKGKVVTYGQIASYLGKPGASRAVGNILHVNPDPIGSPCFRVVNREGRLADNFGGGGPEVQKARLEADGIEVCNYRVNLKKYRWDGVLREEKMKKTYDIIVAGGGFAGVAAAVAAARHGADVLIVEQYNALGGAAVFDLIYPFMKNRTIENGEKKLLSGGIYGEIIEMLRQAGVVDDDGRRFDTEYLKLILNRLVLGAGVSLLFDAVVTGVEAANGKVSSVTVHTVAGNSVFTAKRFIDCTGDANLAAMAGFGYTVGRKEDGLCQPMTLCFRLGNVKKEYFDRKKINSLYKEYKEAGKLRNPREDVLIFNTSLDSVWHFNTTRVVKLDPTDAADVTAAEIEAREQMFEMLDFLKANFEAFRDAVPLSSGIRIGARESRMIKGRHTLTKDEIMSCTKFADGIAACNYDIDIHSPDGSGTSHYFFPAGCWYTIPYRCLVPEGSENLIVAGRCISCDHDAQASLRIMPVCCTLGEAAGNAAALSLDEGVGVACIDTDRLREILNTAGCIVD